MNTDLNRGEWRLQRLRCCSGYFYDSSVFFVLLGVICALGIYVFTSLAQGSNSLFPLICHLNIRNPKEGCTGASCPENAGIGSNMSPIYDDIQYMKQQSLLKPPWTLCVKRLWHHYSFQFAHQRGFRRVPLPCDSHFHMHSTPTRWAFCRQTSSDWSVQRCVSGSDDLQDLLAGRSQRVVFYTILLAHHETFATHMSKDKHASNHIRDLSGDS